ncbi:hypothetical protein NUU61_003026 [Penicillium alfredii]|uniref:Cytochrome P450 monooxygenase n=1 Tax=Penicillium alfredii TaxID=1506179 RepID=A0A9W9FST2_9EURO|nr:uncharacterized protein NUU61_003026 [Penicillium alfredii]KAJ5105679.1 hypothetical protein NUU61_003026 [Penicillium alfredii]
MGRIKDNFGILYFGVAAALYFKPEYAIRNSSIATFAVLFAIITVSKIIYQLILYPQYFTPLKDIETPPVRHWLTGNTSSMFLHTPYAQIQEWIKSVPNEGLIRYYIVGNMERVIPLSAKALSEILVTKVYDFEKPEAVRASLERITGNGVLLAEGEDHKQIQRKNLMPAFSYRHIKDLYPVFWSKSAEMVRLIERDLAIRNSPDNTIQVRNYSSRTTLDIIGVAGMDHDFDSLRNPDNMLNRAYRKIIAPPSFLSRILLVAVMLFANPKLVQRLPTQRNKEIQEGGDDIRNVARQMIRQKKAKMADPGAKTGVDIISVALQSGTFEEENLVDQLMTFLGAGHETTSGALQWAVYALCKHPGIQTRLREEVRAHLPSISTADPISAAAIDNLPYLHAVCNEVLRFYPSVPTTIRKAARDTTLVGKHIPKGTFLIISPKTLNHMEELWGADAGQFNPDRFMSPGNANMGGATSNYAFLSFLHGPRGCIGQGFARAELACLLAATVGHFHMELKYPDAPLELMEGATVSPKDGVLARFTPLEGW